MSANFRLSNDEKIALLEELHRPLEEHWSVKTKFGLDPKSSDYIYKHHITRLEDIYTNHKHDFPAAPGLLFMSPVSQLYGVNGLNVINDGKHLKRKEDKWVSNFQKHAFLSDGGVDREEQRDRSVSPLKPKPAVFGPSRAESRKRKGEVAPQPASSKSTRSACLDPGVTPEDLVMLGMYRLDEAQEEAYRLFVQMLSGFDDHDKANIVADALKDAQGEADLLDMYGGTMLPEPLAARQMGPEAPARPNSAVRRPASPAGAAAYPGDTGRPRTAGGEGLNGHAAH